MIESFMGQIREKQQDLYGDIMYTAFNSRIGRCVKLLGDYPENIDPIHMKAWTLI